MCVCVYVVRMNTHTTLVRIESGESHTQLYKHKTQSQTNTHTLETKIQKGRNRRFVEYVCLCVCGSDMVGAHVCVWQCIYGPSLIARVLLPLLWLWAVRNYFVTLGIVRESDDVVDVVDDDYDVGERGRRFGWMCAS